MLYVTNYFHKLTVLNKTRVAPSLKQQCKISNVESLGDHGTRLMDSHSIMKKLLLLAVTHKQVLKL